MAAYPGAHTFRAWHTEQGTLEVSERQAIRTSDFIRIMEVHQYDQRQSL